MKTKSITAVVIFNGIVVELVVLTPYACAPDGVPVGTNPTAIR